MEAIEETKRVRTYFETEDQAIDFAHMIRDQKEIEKSDERDPAPVDMTPWSKAKDASIAIVLATVAIYILLSLAAS